MDELKSPCETCEKAETCKTENCAKWNEWFRRCWRGWIMAIKNYTTTIDVYKSLGEIQCSRCMSLLTTSHGERKPFCPTCSSANTDEAVQMVLERLEALYGDR